MATLLIIWGTFGYIRDIFRGTVTPNLVTWFLWSLAPLIALGAQLTSGAGAEVALSAAVGLCPLAVFIAGIKQGSFRPQPFDWWCGGMSLVALVAWLATGSGVVGIGLSILADTFGALPTLRKSYKNPESESPTFFALFAFSAFITLLTITQWSIVTAGFSLYIFVLYVVLFILVKYNVGRKIRTVFAVVDEAQS